MAAIKEFIVICGKPGAGKDTAAERVAQMRKLWHVSAGDVLRHEAERRGKSDLTRETLARIKDDMDKANDAPIVTKAIEQYDTRSDTYPGGLVISGLRRVREVQCAKDKGAHVIFIDAPEEIRYKWIEARMRADNVGLDEHKKREKIEAEGLTAEGKEGVWLDGVEAMADSHIMNDGTLQEFQQAMDEILKGGEA